MRTRRSYLLYLLSIVFLTLATVGGVSGCAQDVGDIDRTQPNAIEKGQFEGEWFYQSTVVDVPPGNTFTFVGSSDFGGMRRVVWDIQEDFLYARLSYAAVENAEGGESVEDGYMGQPVAAFRIESHFDIVREYNPTTGEQTNVLSENVVDRPWYERSHMRVDWSRNMIVNPSLDFEMATAEPVAYFPQQTGDEPHPDAPRFEEDGSYFDVTTKLIASAGTIDYPGYGQLPLCWLFGEEFTACTASEYTIRHSFLKVDPARQYQPFAYNGKASDVFGYFTSERQEFDEREGIRYQNQERYLTRHNLWVNWFDESGAELPVSERTLRPIVYHVNQDFPERLKPVAHRVADQWNEVFTEAVEAQGYVMGAGERAFILCPNNPIAAGDPAACGEEGDAPRLGDVRYSFMAWVPKFMDYGLLGLGPSNNDPLTGEIYSGMAYIYQMNDRVSHSTTEMIQLLTESRDPTTFIDGVDLTNLIGQVVGDKAAPQRTFDLDDAAYLARQTANNAASGYWQGQRYQITEADLAAQREHGVSAWLKPFISTMYARGFLNGETRSPEGRLAQLRGSYIEDLLINDEVMIGAGIDPSLPVTDETLAQVSVTRGGFARFFRDRHELRERFAAERNMYLPEMADDALMGFARQHGGGSYDEIYADVQDALYTAVLAHEVGHSLGLMHNFGASDDAINYHDEYWKIRDDGQVGPRLTDPMTDAELDADLYSHGYSSIMDYAAHVTIDGQGIGKYDRAAILFAYAGKVEVFEDSAGVPYEDFFEWFDRDGDIVRFENDRPYAVHYTSFYNRMGAKLYEQSNRRLVDLDQLSEDFSTAEVDGQAYNRVPYIYCSHSRSNLGDACLTRDAGADTMERMKNIVDGLNTWYIMRNFPRGQVGVSDFGYVNRYYGRVFDRFNNWVSLYALYADLLPQFYAPAALEAFYLDPETGWGPQTWAVQNAFNYLVQTLMMPDVGTYSGPSLQPDGTRYMEANVSFSGIEVGVDQGRYYSTDWFEGQRECGYTWWECMHHIGFYLDKIMAVEALSDSRTNFVARSTPQDIREWEVSFYNLFPEQINAISAGLMSQDWSAIAPYFDDNDQVSFPNYAGPLDEVHARAMDPAAAFSIALYWQVLGQARFMTNFDRSFNQESMVFVMGTANQPDLAPENLITFRDPLSNLTYGAIRFDDRPSAGQAMIERANRLLAASSLCDLFAETPELVDDCVAPPGGMTRARVTLDLRSYIEWLQVVADISNMMDGTANYGDPYSP